MDSDTLNDLKQFISATVSQQLSLQLDDFKDEVGINFKKIDDRLTEIDKRLDESDEKLDDILDAIDTSLLKLKQV